jgi:acyl carrier protein
MQSYLGNFESQLAPWQPTESPDDAPRTDAERKLWSIWREVLNIDQLGIHDDFLELGGHSLMAMLMLVRIQKSFGVKLPLRTVFQHSTIAELASAITAAEKCGTPAPIGIPRVRRDQPLPLSFSQERLWFLERMHPGNRAYNFQAAIHFRGVLRVGALERSLRKIVRRHEIYRTTFIEVDGQSRQRVQEEGTFLLQQFDLSGLEKEARQREYQRLVNQELETIFDLARLPLVRWTLFRLAEDEYALLHLEHHLLHDGWSFHIFLRELLALYEAFSAGRPSPLSELPIQFADFACWEREQIGEHLKADLTYWKERLAGAPELLPLPLDHPRPSVQTFHGTAPHVELAPELCRRLRAFSAGQGVSLFTVLLTGFVALLQRYSRAVDLCLGITDSNRRRRELEDLMGMFVINLVLRVQSPLEETFVGLMERVREEILKAHEHPHAPFEKVVEALALRRNLAFNPLVQVLFSSHDAPRPALELPGLRLRTEEPLSNGTAKFDLNVIVLPWNQAQSQREGITLVWEYNTNLFERATMDRMARDYATVLETAIADPGCRISGLSLAGDTVLAPAITVSTPVTPWQPASARRVEGPIDEEIQGAVVEILQDVLGCGPIRPEDDFFELGGHSLAAMQVVARLHRRFAIRLPLRALFESSSVRQLSVAVAEQCHALNPRERFQ